MAIVLINALSNETGSWSQGMGDIDNQTHPLGLEAIDNSPQYRSEESYHSEVRNHATEHHNRKNVLDSFKLSI